MYVSLLFVCVQLFYALHNSNNDHCKYWRQDRSEHIVIILIFVQGSSSDSDDEGKDEGLSAKSFLKKKPEPSSEASKFLKSAKGSGVRRHNKAAPQRLLRDI